MAVARWSSLPLCSVRRQRKSAFPDRDEPFPGALRQDAIKAAEHVLELDAASTCGRAEWSRVFVLETEDSTRQGTHGSYQLKDALELLEAEDEFLTDLNVKIVKLRVVNRNQENCFRSNLLRQLLRNL